jgi:hypothetical protein
MTIGELALAIPETTRIVEKQLHIPKRILNSFPEGQEYLGVRCIEMLPEGEFPYAAFFLTEGQRDRGMYHIRKISHVFTLDDFFASILSVGSKDIVIVRADDPKYSKYFEIWKREVYELYSYFVKPDYSRIDLSLR